MITSPESGVVEGKGTLHQHDEFSHIYPFNPLHPLTNPLHPLTNPLTTNKKPLQEKILKGFCFRDSGFVQAIPNGIPDLQQLFMKNTPPEVLGYGKSLSSFPPPDKPDSSAD